MRDLTIHQVLHTVLHFSWDSTDCDHHKHKKKIASHISTYNPILHYEERKKKKSEILVTAFSFLCHPCTCTKKKETCMQQHFLRSNSRGGPLPEKEIRGLASTKSNLASLLLLLVKWKTWKNTCKHIIEDSYCVLKIKRFLNSSQALIYWENPFQFHLNCLYFIKTGAEKKSEQ